MPSTIRDVARRAGVSTATVSRILAGLSESRPETVEAVRKAVEELHYRPSGVARSLKLRSTRTLGLIVTDVQNPFFPELIRAIEDAAFEAGQTVLLCNAAEDPEREANYLDVLVDRRVDGIIVAASDLTQRHADWLAASPVPVVVVNSNPRVPGVPVILSDDRAGGRLAAAHLLELGHRRLGVVAGPPGQAASKPRLEGVIEAVAEFGSDLPRPAVAVGDGHVEGGEAAAQALLAETPDVTGIVCFNDLTAIGTLRALRAAGRHVPDDVSVVGFDDIAAAAWVDPPLTTVAQQKAAMGRWAVERLAEAIAGRSYEPSTAAHEALAAGVVVQLPVTLAIRGSTGPARS